MIKICSSQFNYLWGNQIHFPYSVGMLVTYAKTKSGMSARRIILSMSMIFLSISYILNSRIMKQKNNINLTIRDQLLQKIIHNQNKQAEVLNKIRWAIIGLGFFIIVTTMMLKVKWGL